MECPNCSEIKQIRVLDTGLKKFIRGITDNNRYVCLMCNSTWRKKKPREYRRIKTSGIKKMERN
jgi:hypothetical protein